LVGAILPLISRYSISPVFLLLAAPRQKGPCGNIRKKLFRAAAVEQGKLLGAAAAEQDKQYQGHLLKNKEHLMALIG